MEANAKAQGRKRPDCGLGVFRAGLMSMCTGVYGVCVCVCVCVWCVYECELKILPNIKACWEEEAMGWWCGDSGHGRGRVVW